MSGLSLRLVPRELSLVILPLDDWLASMDRLTSLDVSFEIAPAVRFEGILIATRPVDFRKGHDGLRRQRCKGCGRTFSSATGTVLARVRLPEKVLQVVEDMLGPNPGSCRALAGLLGLDKVAD